MAEPVSTTIAAGLAAMSYIGKLTALGVCMLLGANTYAAKVYKAARATKERYSPWEYLFNIVGGLCGGLTMLLLTLIVLEGASFASLLLATLLGGISGFEGVQRVGDLLFNLMESKYGKK